MEQSPSIAKRQLPKLMACMTKVSLENMRNRVLFGVDFLDAKGIRRRKLPLHECLILELREAGYNESSSYLQDLLYDNAQLVAEDDIGIVVDLRKREDYLEHICSFLQMSEKERDKDNVKKECLIILDLAQQYSEKGKGILWLAEKFYLAAIAVASRYLIDGGRQKGVCKFHYAKFLLDKFPGADPEESYLILTEVRDACFGKTWPLYESEDGEDVPPDTLFYATAMQLHRVLLSKSRAVRKADPAKSERLARLAERRAKDANDASKTAEAIIEVGICQLIMNNLNNAQKTFERAFKIHTEFNNVEGLCETRMHLAAVMQRLGEHETAARLLTEMGTMAMENELTLQLGRALHLLGELHLRRERPELGTQHLAEAFTCFMGVTTTWTSASSAFRLPTVKLLDTPEIPQIPQDADLDVIFKNKQGTMYLEEAEQSRLMMAISAGQELMASYFNLIREAGGCTVAKVKTIEWKLSKSSWWVKRHHHAFMPCMCAVHKRTPLDVLWLQIELREQERLAAEQSVGGILHENAELDDLTKLRSSYFDTQQAKEIQVEKL